ncbi:uncharacterized protein LOC144712646 [Wolffia australiana]
MDDESMLASVLGLEAEEPLFEQPLPAAMAAAFSEGEEEDEDEDKKGGLPWQRMKWSDDMVRLLISAVSAVDDDGAAGGLLQKKGKWKAVSKAMLLRGCSVSPQQCEDKFNDLNKRYKRLTDLLGRPASCDIADNPSLLDSLPHLSAKAKDDARKILASKHLFYREMCAFHSGHSHAPPPSPPHDDDDDLSHPDPNFGPNFEGFQAEIDGVLLDGGRSIWERRDWLRKRRLQIEEERIEIELRGFDLEKRRFKWQRFCSNKDRELERLRLANERASLENKRMSLQLRQIEAELESGSAPDHRFLKD